MSNRQRKATHKARKRKGREAHAATFNACKKQRDQERARSHPMVPMFLGPELSVAAAGLLIERLLRSQSDADPSF